MRKSLVVLALAAVQVVTAQQPQTQTAPIDAVNAKYVNGTAPGYRPTAGAGLTLNVGPGTAFCSGTVVTYAGGSLTMVSGNNYVYLNTSANCSPATKATAFTTSDIPVAVVVASSSAITSVTDDRTPFQQGNTGSSGSGSGSSSTSWTDNGILVSTPEDVAGKSFTATNTGQSAVVIVPADTYANIVAAYPCTSSVGYHTTVIDSPVASWGAVLTAGGGTHKVGAFCDGTNWTVEAATTTVSTGGGGCMTPMTVSVAANTSDVSFANIPQTCTNLTVMAYNLMDNGSDNYIQMYINSDTGNDYDWVFCSSGEASTAAWTCSNSLGQSNAMIGLGGQGDGQTPGNLVGTILNYTNVGLIKSITTTGTYWANSTIVLETTALRWRGTSAITQIDFKVGSGYQLMPGTVIELIGN